MELSRHEFETLPPTVRRKCLSNSERLKYTQVYGTRPELLQTAPAPQPRPPVIKIKQTAPASRHQSYFARDFLHPKPCQSRTKSVAPQHDATASRPLSSGRQSTKALTSNNISSEDALFFSRLPEKLQLRQFSAAERQLLVGRQYILPPLPPIPREKKAVVFTSEDRAHTLHRRAANRSLPSLSSTCSGQSTPRSSSTDDLETLRTEEDMDDHQLDNFHWMEDSDADLGIDDYHVHLASVSKPAPEPKLYQAAPRPTSSNRRDRSFTNFSLKTIPRQPERTAVADAPRHRLSMDPNISRNPRSTLSIAPPVPLNNNPSQPPPTLKETSLPQTTEVRIPKLDKAPSRAEKRANQGERRATVANETPSHMQWQGAGWQPPAEWWQPLPRNQATSRNRKSSIPEPPHSAGLPRPPPLPAADPRRVSTSSPGRSAEHYLNPEARLKLRRYLASPDKFDEALQYGFPTLSSPIRATAPRISTSSRNSMPARPTRSRTVHDGAGGKRAQRAVTTADSSASSTKLVARGPTHSHSLTFLRDETTPEMSVDGSKDVRQRRDFVTRQPSLSYGQHGSPDGPDEAAVEDDGALTETPDVPEYGAGAAKHFKDDGEYAHSVDPEDLSSPGLTATSPGLTESSVEFERELARERLESFDHGEREMTMRMTLTRPELRADDAALYPHTAHLVAPRTRFIGKGMGGKPAPGAPMEALSMERLFDDEPVAIKNKTGGFRRLFSRKR